LDDAAFATVDRDDAVTVLYTSGTTGRPRGAVNTHRGTISNLMNTGFAMMREAVISERPPAPPKQPGSVMVGPIFHIGGIASLVGGALSGSKLVLLNKWDAAATIALAEAEGISTLGGVPTVARELLDQFDRHPPRFEVRGLAMGGASVPPDLPRRAIAMFGDTVQLFNGYGCTETTSAVVTNVGVEFASHPESIGRPCLTTDLEIRDLAGTALGVGEVGELCIRSPQNARGYWNDPVGTAATFVDGWVRTGDLGYVDDEGFVHVVDRLKDVVIRGGENVYCAEVEAAMVEHPDVVDASVIGIPDARLGEVVCAVVVPKAGTRIALDELRAFCATRLARFKCPEALCVVDELPRTATAKIAKAELRTMVTDTPDCVEYTR
jgi:acyl-CoA synthetase (AMP-forming)/AMP-acid ligase II